MKSNNWVSASQARELLTKQKMTWPLIKKNYADLKEIRTKTFDMDGFQLTVQFNPARIRSSGAKVDRESIKERICFLCPFNLPFEQERLFFGKDYLFLCNPYPIFPEHFTVPARLHTDQLIKSHFLDFLELTKRISPFTVFYNGPMAGASAPDHLHFQVVTPQIMPLDRELASLKTKGQGLIEEENGRLDIFTGYIRNGFLIQSDTTGCAQKLFLQAYELLDIHPGEAEPKMNLFGYHLDNKWTLVLIPRKQHRPWQFNAEGEDHLLASPGAADIGGLFITTVEKDYDRMDRDLLMDIYQQVCFSDEDIRTFAQPIKSL